ncbi:hypothetical protein PPACK8108_LOCUS16719 [Phakopsora pachyrhizi]|uniref:Uncharacterized protein n=1 Tax=Phakopsora pachyrhizi TaxID=170000 RepID=A0AAV0B800_PHAPC|nr:hypothetical protein PPACK8108_LOCUS16719 [Phakopsora pachyrhizi]
MKNSPSKPCQEKKSLYQSLYLRGTLIASPSDESSSKKEQDQVKRSNFGVERSSVKSTDQKKNLYSSASLKDSLNSRKEHKSAFKSKQEAGIRLEVLRAVKKEVEDYLFNLVVRKTSISRKTSVAGEVRNGGALPLEDLNDPRHMTQAIDPFAHETVLPQKLSGYPHIVESSKPLDIPTIAEANVNQFHKAQKKGKDLIVKNKVLGLDEPYRLSTSESSHFNIGSVLDRNSELSNLQEGRMIKSYEENLDVY